MQGCRYTDAHRINGIEEPGCSLMNDRPVLLADPCCCLMVYIADMDRGHLFEFRVNADMVTPHCSDTDYTDFHLAHPVDGITDKCNLLLVQQRVDGEAEYR